VCPTQTTCWQCGLRREGWTVSGEAPCGRSTCCEKMAQLAARPVARTSRFGGLARKRHVSTLERGAQVARLCATGFAFATTIGCVVALEMQIDLRSSQYHTARPRCNTLHWVKVGYYWRRVVTLRLPASLSVPECSMERDVADVEGELVTRDLRVACECGGCGRRGCLEDGSHISGGRIDDHAGRVLVNTGRVERFARR